MSQTAVFQGDLLNRTHVSAFRAPDTSEYLTFRHRNSGLLFARLEFVYYLKYCCYAGYDFNSLITPYLARRLL